MGTEGTVAPGLVILCYFMFGLSMTFSWEGYNVQTEDNLHLPTEMWI